MRTTDSIRRCADLEAYARELNPQVRLLLLLNKADYLTAQTRLDLSCSQQQVTTQFSAARHLGPLSHLPQARVGKFHQLGPTAGEAR